MPGSTPSYRSELDLFSNLPTDVSVNSSDFQAYYPLSTIRDNDNPIEFYVYGNGTHYLDLYTSYIYVRFKILRQNGSNLQSTDLVSPGNLFFSTMFQNVYIALNNVQVYDSANTYPYLAWIQKQLAYGEGIKKTELTTELYYKDSTPEDFTASNPGFKARHDLAAESKSVEMIGRICSSIFNQKRYLPTGVDVSLTLRRSHPEFCLSSATKEIAGITGCPFKVKIEDCILYIRKHLVNPQVYNHFTQHFSSNKNALYPIKRVNITSFTLPIGSLGTTGEVLYTGKLPESLTVGFVTSSGVSGQLDKNPFNFQHFKLTNIAVIVDNETPVYRSYTFDFPNQQYLQGYYSLFNATSFRGEGNDLERTDYPKGNTLIFFDLQPTSTGGRYQIERTGQVKIEIKFAEALTEPVNCIVYGQFQSIIKIDGRKNVYADVHN